VVVVGVVSRVEVWSPERYKQANAKIESDVNAVAERMGQIVKRAAGKADH
jgi:DNA-binding transcriptional regulator/RsmH inhibitor MraZ